MNEPAFYMEWYMSKDRMILKNDILSVVFTQKIQIAPF